MNTVQSAEEAIAVLSGIANSFVRHTEGMRLGKQLKDRGMIQTHALLFIKALLAQKIIPEGKDMGRGEHRLDVSRTEEIRDYLKEKSFGSIVSLISPDKLSEVLLPYIQFEANIANEKDERFREALNLISENPWELRDEEKDAYYKKVSEMLMKLSHESVSVKYVKRIFDFAQKSNDKLLLKKVTDYCNKKIAQATKPKKVSDLSEGDSLLELVKEIVPSKYKELQEINTAGQLFDSNHYFDDDEYVIRLTEENMDDYFHQGFELAASIFEQGNEENLLYLVKVLKEPRTLKLKSQKKRLAKAMAVALIEWSLQKENRLHEDTQKQILVDYKCIKSVSKELVQSELIELLSNGAIETAHNLSELMSVSIDSYIISRAEELINFKIRKHEESSSDFEREVFNPYSYSSSRNEKFSDDVDSIIELHQRKRHLWNYLKKGMAKLEDVIPESDLTENYNGKIMLFEVGDHTFLRTLAGTQGDMHSDIVRKFYDEVHQKGFSETIKKAGGAHVKIEHNGCLIYDASMDYGECDKDTAKAIIENQFPDMTVQTQRAN